MRHSMLAELENIAQDIELVLLLVGHKAAVARRKRRCTLGLHTQEQTSRWPETIRSAQRSYADEEGKRWN